MESVSCPVCDGTGKVTEKDHYWEPVYDGSSGYHGFYYQHKQTKEIVLHKSVPDKTYSCFNCEGQGTLSWDE